MSFDIKLFNFTTQQPYKISTLNKRQFYIISKKKNPSEKYTLIVQQVHNNTQLQNCNNEAFLQALGSHANVIQSKGTCYLDSLDEFGFRNQRFCFLTEEVKSTLLDEMIYLSKIKEQFTLDQIKNIFKQILTALSNLELKNIAFVNLHPDNIFINMQNQIKLGCFDQAVNTIGFNQINIDISKNGLLSSYMDPNFKQESFDFIKGDIYCLGQVMIDICLLKLKRDQQFDPKQLSQVTQKYGEQISNLLEKMVVSDSKSRIGYKEILTQFKNILDIPEKQVQFLDSMNDRSNLSKFNYSKNIQSKVNEQPCIDFYSQYQQNELKLEMTEVGSVISQVFQGNLIQDKTKINQNYDNEQDHQQDDNLDSMFVNGPNQNQSRKNQDQNIFKTHKTVFENNHQAMNIDDNNDFLESLLDKHIEIAHIPNFNVYNNNSNYYLNTNQQEVIQLNEYQCDTSYEYKNNNEAILEISDDDDYQENLKYLLTFKNSTDINNMLKTSHQQINEKQNDIITFQYLEKNISEFPLRRVKLHQLKIIPTKQPDTLQQCHSSNNSTNNVIKIYKNLDNELVYQLLYHNVLVSLNSQCPNILIILEYALIEKDIKSSDLYVVLPRKQLNLIQYLKINKIQYNSRIAIAIQITKAILNLKVQSNLIDILDGLEYYSHGNLKPQNILMDLRGNSFITDFGTGRLPKKNKPNSCHLAPEILLNNEFNQINLESDIWSLGIIFYWLFFNKNLSEADCQQFGLYDENRKGCIIVDKNIVKDDYLKNELRNLIFEMTQFDPVKRIKIHNVMKQLNSLEQYLANPQKNELEIVQKKKQGNLSKLGSKLNIQRTKTPNKSIRQVQSKLITK